MKKLYRVTQITPEGLNMSSWFDAEDDLTSISKALIQKIQRPDGRVGEIVSLAEDPGGSPEDLAYLMASHQAVVARLESMSRKIPEELRPHFDALVAAGSDLGRAVSQHLQDASAD